MSIRPKIHWMLLLIALLVLAACGAPATGGVAEPDPSAALDGLTWQLERMGPADAPEPLIPGSNVTAEFVLAEQRLAGNAGCNGYFAEAEIVDGQLQIRGAGSTEMACMEPEGIMQQESLFLDLLSRVSGHEVDGDTLRLFAEDFVLEFERQ